MKLQIHAQMGAAAVLGAVAFTAPAGAQTTGATQTHDPSRMIESEGRVYQYATGGDAKSSADGLNWKDDTAPPWNTSYVPNNSRIWAPDGLYLNGQYLLYGSLYATNNKASAIVLLTTPSLNPSDAKWADKGVAVAGPAGVSHSCIDPAPVLDAQGNLWVSWGGGYPFDTKYDSIFITRMDNATGLPLTTDPGYKPPSAPGYAIASGHKEGSYVYYHGGAYFLWYQTGNCCGTNNPYTMHVARASSITGPYSGDRVFLASSSGRTGPGHIGIYNCGGVERFTYHYISSSGTVIGENTLSWGSDGWPNANSPVSTGLKLPCTTTTTPPPSGGAGGDGSGGSTSVGGSDSGGGTGGADAGNTGGGTDIAGGPTGGNAGGNADGSPDGTAGTPVAGGGSPDTTAGAPAVAGSAPASAGAMSAPTDGTSDAGCSCSVRGERRRTSVAGLLALAMVAVFSGRRRRAQRQAARKN